MEFLHFQQLQLTSRTVFFAPALPALPSKEPLPGQKKINYWSFIVLFITSVVMALVSLAQTADGNNGLNQANTMVRSYFDTGTQLLYGIGALVGLVGAFKVYRSFDARDGQMGMHAATWFGASIFLVMAATVLKSFYGL